ncbi:hypothetical protein BT67DRAFT_253518 [Trichocladium antarcticum]|uniref:Uncharacterized protein n=1 Tax=Trichocladium antarcticum TaxID=1450529 RepID=A0AAN6UML4_9PEZI|nr:hypothetical protein BT67DRAFT_253518 [Trichocladium antarcticum]
MPSLLTSDPVPSGGVRDWNLYPYLPSQVPTPHTFPSLTHRLTVRARGGVGGAVFPPCVVNTAGRSVVISIGFDGRFVHTRTILRAGLQLSHSLLVGFFFFFFFFWRRLQSTARLVDSWKQIVEPSLRRCGWTCRPESGCQANGTPFFSPRSSDLRGLVALWSGPVSHCPPGSMPWLGGFLPGETNETGGLGLDRRCRLLFCWVPLRCSMMQAEKLLTLPAYVANSPLVHCTTVAPLISISRTWHVIGCNLGLHQNRRWWCLTLVVRVGRA